MSASPLDRRQPPVAGPVKAFEFPPFLHQRLSNGLEVYVARVDRVPLVDLEILSRAGSLFDPEGKPGLASLHGDLLDEGTVRRSGTEIAIQVEGLGGSLGSGAGWNGAYAEAGLLSRHLDAGLDLLTDIVRHANFPQHEIDRLRQRRVTDLLRRRDQPTALVDRQMAKALYGDGVYGHAASGEPETLDRLDRDAFVRFNQRHMRAAGSTFLAVGDLDPEDMLRRVESCFGDWPAGEPSPLPPFATRPLDGVEVYIVDRPEATQTQLQLGHVGVPRSHGDFSRLVLLNSIFGGKFTSRINLNLREERGFTYGAQSTFERRLGPGAFFIRTAVANEVSGRAVEELLKEMRRIREEAVTQEELDDARSYMTGYFASSMQTVGDLLKRLENLAMFELPDDYYDRYSEILESIDRQTLLQAAQQHLKPHEMVIIAAGPAEQLRPQLEAFGRVQVVTPDDVMGSS